MPVITADLLSNIRTGVNAEFHRAYEAAVADAAWRPLTIFQDSAGFESYTYDWFGSVPTLTEFDGELELGGLSKYSFTLTNAIYSGGFEVSRDAIERDRLGQITTRTRQLAEEAARHPAETLFAKIVAGTSDTAFDGTAFFANTRVIGSSANIDNLLAATGTSAANVRTDIALVRASMLRFEDDKGRPMNKAPNTFLIPPELSSAFYEALNVGAGALETGVQPASATGVAIWQGKGYTVIECPYLSDAGDWYAFHVSSNWAPFVYQLEQAPQVESVTDPNSHDAIVRRRFIYSATTKYAIGYTDPRLAIKVA